MNFETGKRFGPYEILSELGGGGMGMVYRAFDPRLHREVALKVLRPQYDSPGVRERFLREARAVSALNHPNICTIFDIGEQDGEPYLVMELLHGETLRDRIERGPLTTAEIVDAGTHIADALAEAHSKGIIHRDIKPANIFLVKKNTAFPQVKVLDFGLAKIQSLTDSFESENLTGTGATVGTVAYMSPEQARGDELDTRSDLFSFGSLLYEMATGQLPFTGATSAMVFVALLSKDPDPVRDWNPAIPRELERIILKALTKESRHRYRTADEMRDALKAVTAKVPSQGRFFKPRAMVDAEDSDAALPSAGDPVARGKRQIPRQGDALRGRPLTPQPPSGGQTAKPVRASGKTVSNGISGDLDAMPVAHRESGSPGSGIPAAGPRASSHTPPAASEAELRRAALAMEATALHEAFRSVSGAAIAAAKQGNGARFAGPESADPQPSPRSGRDSVNTAPSARTSDSLAQHFSAQPLSEIDSPWSRSLGSAGAGADDPEPSVSGGISAGERGSGSSIRRAAHKRPVPEGRRARSRRRWLLSAAVATLGIAGLGAYVLSGGRLRPAPLGSGDQLLVASMENKTGDPLLDGTLREAVLMNLRQSPTLHVLSDAAVASRLRMAHGNAAAPLTRAAAESLAQQQGIKAFVAGAVAGTSPYSIDLEAVNAQTGAVLAHVSESAADRDHLLDAAGRAADAMRVRLGEASDAVNSQHIPLTQATTSSLEAFHDFAAGNEALAQGDAQGAIAQYQRAVALDPKFALACAQLARADAEVMDMDQAAGRARQANDLGAALSDRDRLYVDAEFNILGNHDLLKAAEEVEERMRQFPHDTAAPGVLATIYNAMGRYADAHDEAQKKIGASSHEASGYQEEQSALIGLDRYEAASRVQQEAAKHGVKMDGFDAMLAFLGGNQSLFAQDAALAITPGASYRARENYALILDDTGQFETAAFQWQALARDAEAARLNGAAGYVLAQGAMDRALAGQCEGTLAMAGEAAALAHDSSSQFHVAMAAAMCGNAAVAQGIIDDFNKNNPMGTLVSGFYVPDIQGAIALKAGDPKKALDALNAARTYDLISPTPYLRGLAHLAAGQEQLALGDFQQVLAHRGAALVSGNIAYSLAQAGVGQAYGAIGDKQNSADAYRKFLSDWQQADTRLPLVVQATKDSR